MKTFKFLHRWLAIVATFFILLFALSGIVLNHRSFFSGINVNRKYLPQSYHYHNWNLAAVKSALVLGSDSVLVYGNIGIWLTDTAFSHWEPFHQGLPRGIDNRRTAAMVKAPCGSIFAGTMSGLYRLQNQRWEAVKLPVKEKRITALSLQHDQLWIMTRSYLLRMDTHDPSSPPQRVVIPYAADHKREASMFRALWVIHSGEILGLPGKLLVDLMALAMIFLCISGIIWFVAPDVMKKLRNRMLAKKRMAALNRFSLKWHNRLGIYLLAFLIILTLTGMFLRPPLLIAIAPKKVKAWKYTILDHPNPWHDKLRDIQYDRLSQGFILSTSDGFYYADPAFNQLLMPLPVQPPISVMGINVFEQPDDGVFITASFSGIHRWVPSEYFVQDYITGRPVVSQGSMGNPFGNIPVAGFIQLPEQGPLLFDYNAGVFSLPPHQPFVPMPAQVRSQSPMSLWHLALEVHTGRIYSFMFGRYYILFIPLAGLIILTILISGGLLWWKQQRRKKTKTSTPKL